MLTQRAKISVSEFDPYRISYIRRRFPEALAVTGTIGNVGKMGERPSNISP